MKTTTPHPGRAELTWSFGARCLELGKRTLIMGVVNITPDSFSDGGLFLDPTKAVEHALRLLDEGADILDFGAESTRPGSMAGDPDHAAVTAKEEQERLIPVLKEVLRLRPGTLISVDTYKAATARAAVSAGAEIVNDVSGFNWDPAMAETCAELSCGVVLMHTRGRPEEWKFQEPQVGDELLAIVSSGLAASMQHAIDSGISSEAIVLDPGYGFGKRFDENYALMARQDELLGLGRPLVAGVSRKSFLRRTIERNQFNPSNQEIDSALVETASNAAQVAAILTGASIVRTHSVRAAVQAASIADALLAAR